MRIVKGIDMAGPGVHLDTKQREGQSALKQAAGLGS